MSASLNPFNPDKNFLESPSEYPFISTSGTVPPLKLCSHWDATKMLTYILPDQRVAMPLSFRPLTKICTQYVTTAVPEPLPATGTTIFPSGGDVYPPNRYLSSVDNESLLRRQDRPLGLPDKKQFVPDLNGEMFQSRIFMSTASAPSSAMVDELSMPKALLNVGPYVCRSQQDSVNMERSQLLFNNSTKNQKYKERYAQSTLPRYK